MATARVSRGRKTQVLLAEWFQREGWPSAQSMPASLPGRDITGMPGLAPEVKATKEFDMGAALRQAEANAKGDLAFVVRRMNGQGPEKITAWPVVIRLDHFTALLRTAGYGSDTVEIVK